MDRRFDYSQKILIAVEYGTKPRLLTDSHPSHSLFQRIAIPEVVDAFDDAEGFFVKLLGGRKFRAVLDEHMGYWEKRIPAGQECYVHYFIGGDAEMEQTFQRLGKDWTLLGVYHLEPQSSAYPFAFPAGNAINHWRPGVTPGLTSESVFWFNFFPEQPRLFEKTFPIWMLFNMFQGKEGGECNQLVASDGGNRMRVNGIDPFVQVNLNRFTNLKGYFNSAFEAGRHSFTHDEEYRWYGMLLRKL